MNTVVCWDFDETLGYFRPLEFAWLGAPAPARLPPPRLKPGIRELLESLDEFTHVVTTAAIGEYAREVLREFRLQEARCGFPLSAGRDDPRPADDGPAWRPYRARVARPRA